MPRNSIPEYSPLTMHQSPPSRTIKWHPGFRQFPWIAAAALLTIILCITSLTSVILVSNGQAASSWGIQPSVWLAIISSLANSAVAIAFSQGAPIAWWRAALRGTTVTNLHQTWELGRGYFNLKLSLKKGFNRIAVVAVMVILATTITNPLLQRASHVRNGYVTNARNMLMNMLEDPLNVGYGYYQKGVPADTFLNSIFIESVRRWYSATPISTLNTPSYYCDGLCTGVVTSPGLSQHCTTSTTYLNMLDDTNQGSPLFSIDFDMVQEDSTGSVLRITAIYSAQTSSCIAQVVTEQCDISVGLFQQPIIISNQTITLDQDKAATLISTYNSPFDSTNHVDGDLVGPLYVLYWLGEFYFLSNFTLNLKLSQPTVLASGFGGIGVQFMNLDVNDTCDYTYRNPVPEILDAMTEILFRMAHEYDQDALPTADQTLTVSQSTPTLVIYSSYYYFGAGVGIMVLALIALLIPLWGWWELGRRVTLSPIETAKAFGAPILNQNTAAVHTDGLLKDVGNVRIKYGKVEAFDAESGVAWHELGLGREETVLHPLHLGDVEFYRTHSVPAYTSPRKNGMLSTTIPLT